MAINKIDSNIPSHLISQEKVKEATSGKKENTTGISKETKKTSLEDIPTFSSDAKRLQETEVILQNALKALRDMDEVHNSDLLGIKDKLNRNFYDNDQIADKIIDDIIPERQIRDTITKRLKAEKYVEKLNDIDENKSIDNTRLDKIRDRLESGYYDTPAIYETIAQNLVNVIDI